jgi:hypothetical protein
MLVLPAGRTAAAAIKAASLAPDREAGRAAAAVEQSTSLVAVAAVSLVLAALVRGALAYALLAHGAIVLVLALSASVVGRRKWRATSHRAAPFVLASFLASRVLQFAQVAALAHALGLSASRVSSALGSILVGGSLGDVVPAQLGATDAALSFTAPQLGASPHVAAALAIALHVVQLAWLAGTSLLGVTHVRH